MLVAERHREIVTLVDTEKTVRVGDLARLFAVTEETIRRDLEKLDQDGKLVRSHGGAVSARNGAQEKSFSERRVSNEAEKVAIAREAVKEITAGDTILLDGSTTAWQITRILPDMDLTVVTTAIQVCVELASKPRIRVICTGGTLSPQTLSFVGPRTEQALAGYHVNRLFFSCTGVDLTYGLSDINEAQADLKRHMMRSADRVTLLVDAGKFGIKALQKFGTLTDVHQVITNQVADPDVLAGLQEMELELTLAR
jgi:DeoR/GlpR family transcriptional regulator of sugar metabolism